MNKNIKCRYIPNPWDKLEHLIEKPKSGWKTTSSKNYKKILRPIAETLALLDGNAFFGVETDKNGQDIWYEQYLPQAKVLYENNGGRHGWAGFASFGHKPINKKTKIKVKFKR